MAGLDLLRRIAGSFWARALISAGLLALVATQVEFDEIRERLSGGSWGWFAAAVVALFASFMVGALRWYLFLQAAHVESTPRRALDGYLVGTFASNFLPSQFGGDVPRAFVGAGAGTRMRAAGTIILDRASALGCMLVVGWILVCTDPAAVPGQLLAALAAASGAYTVVFLLVAGLALGRIRAGIVPQRLRPAAAEVRRAVAGGLTRRVLVRTSLIGLGFQGLVYLSIWLVDRSISLGVPVSVLGAALPPVLILAAIPISIGGFGVREGSYVLLLDYAGVSAADATLFSLLTAAVFALASLPGALVLLRRGPRYDRPTPSVEG